MLDQAVTVVSGTIQIGFAVFRTPLTTAPFSLWCGWVYGYFVRAEAKGGQRASPSASSLPWFLRQALPLSWNSQFWVVWLASESGLGRGIHPFVCILALEYRRALTFFLFPSAQSLSPHVCGANTYQLGHLLPHPRGGRVLFTLTIITWPIVSMFIIWMTARIETSFLQAQHLGQTLAKHRRQWE